MPKHDHHKATHQDEGAKSNQNPAEAEKGDEAQASQHSQIANDHSDKAQEASNDAQKKTKGPKKL